MNFYLYRTLLSVVKGLARLKICCSKGMATTSDALESELTRVLGSELLRSGISLNLSSTSDERSARVYI